MKQRLENSLYNVRPVESEIRVYQVGDLESLSSVALYYGTKGSPLGSLGSFGIVKTSLMKDSKIEITPLKNGMTLIDGLNIKKVGRNTISLQEDFGGVGNLYTFHPDGHGANRFYGLGKGKAKEKKTNSW
ncbi:MAG: hypothetical protein KJ949_00745 [Nanoarchaeota archaeon]|nr:hypothetical protein [Nanoarchaeota archaeon]